MPAGSGAGRGAGGHFATTQWSLVLAAADRGSAGAEEALARLCSLYWHPVFAFVRRQGHTADEARDLTQGFFARLIEKGVLRDADRQRGRFRSFVLTACRFFVANQRDRALAQKRGGGRVAISIDLAESRYQQALAHGETPERCLAKDPAQRFSDARSLKLALGVAAEPQLPDTLRAVEGQGMLSGYLGLVWLTLIGELAWPALQCSTAGIFAFVYAFATFRLLREGLFLGESQRVIWREPSWWPLWYPRGLRRRGNVWDRLPARVRQVRAWPLLVCAGAFLLTAGPKLLYVVWGGWHRFPPAFHAGLFTADVVGLGALLALWPILMSRARSALERQGLDAADARRVVLLVPASRTAFWSRPNIEAVLGPDGRADAIRRSDSPHDQLQSILRHAEGLSGPLRALGSQAAAAGRQLPVAIEQADRQVAELARSLDAGEEARLGEKIAALGGAGGDGPAPLCQILERQLDLVRQLRERLEEARAERSRELELLKTLALHVASLHARASEAPAELPSLSERVQSLCDEIGAATFARAAEGGRGQ